MNISKKILKALLIAIIVIAAGFAAIIIYAVISDYRPDEKTTIEVNETPGQLGDSLTLSLLTWNIGYCGLDSKMDFFYDGGKKVFTPKIQCLKNLSAVMAFLKANDSIDIIFLQEVDRKSKRSYKVDEHAILTNHVKYLSNTFAINYNVFFVPVPLSSPMGKVNSGIATLSKYIPASSVRYSFPGTYGFPKQLFMLDRCFMVNRYPLKNGKELLVINTHNEAFDPGDIRKAQMEYLRNFITGEYNKGNYIIAGGDWNQCPPDFKPEFSKNKVNKEQMVVPSDYLPSEWKWIYDNKTPSNRSVIAAYDQSVTTTTVIDFFLLSPNIKALSVQCIDMGFANSDHNPVRMKVRLK
jgi:endonuclease/exonuclease/phosphatase family metal-dependent hydrolase